ncbi:hypothetical protein AMS68_006490 [Peltaster fructicola]|uniref:Fe2OG dioxygenase domain-containing protein n=1 Tax=Peltaster fructicola TaxID=286661 RepID=A0A6H0Y1T6_9PEZI|nr:hypothetical protein AMS68_006490 [Peltaster fructicola]
MALKLSAKQIERFDVDGFLILRQEEHRLIEPSLLQAWTTEVKSLPRLCNKWMPYDELTSNGTRQIMRTENFADFHEGFASLLHGNELCGILAQVTREEMVLFKDKINYKLAGGNGFGAHIDAPAYDHIGQIEHTTANIAVDAANLENGCLEVVRGSHKMVVDLADGGAISKTWEESHEWLPVPLEAGDLLIFGSHLAHRSGDNKTDKPRASVYATYSMVSDGKDLRSRYYQDRREQFPPDHERIPGKDYGLGVKR